MRRPRRTTVRPTLAHGIMVISGLTTFVLVAATLRERGATVPVLVAAAAIEAGTPLEEATLATVDVPAGSPLSAALVRTGEERAGLVLSRPLQQGSPVLQADLIAEAGRTGLRAVALPVERLVLDGLGLRAGDRVDVIGVEPDGSSRFVAVDVGVARLPGEAALGLGRTVDTATTWLTLAVSDGQALAVAAATGRGQLVVARSTGAVPVGATGDPVVGAGVDPAGPPAEPAPDEPGGGTDGGARR